MSETTITIRGRAPGEADFYYTLDRVLGGLLAALKAGRIDEAVDVYTRCREDIGFQLISRAQGDPELFKQTANLFYRARDFARAAYCCEHLEEHEKAASLYERCDDFQQAAQMYAAAGARAKAAEMFEKLGNFAEAARLYRDQGDHVRAAMCFERANKHFDAATAYQQAGKVEKAIEVLNLIDEDSPDRKVANKVIKELMAQTQLKRSQTGQVPAQAAPGLAPAPVSGVGHAAPASGGAPAPILIGGGQVDDSGRGVVTVMEGFDLLHALPLFSELSLSELKSLYHLCDLRNVAPGEKLITAGQPAPALFLNIVGTLEVKAPSGAVVATVSAGQHVGEMSLVDDTPASVDVVATDHGRVLRLERAGFRAALSASDSLAVRVYKVFLRVLAARLRETTARVGL